MLTLNNSIKSRIEYDINIYFALKIISKIILVCCLVCCRQLVLFATNFFQNLNKLKLLSLDYGYLYDSNRLQFACFQCLIKCFLSWISRTRKFQLQLDCFIKQLYLVLVIFFIYLFVGAQKFNLFFILNSKLL